MSINIEAARRWALDHAEQVQRWRELDCEIPGDDEQEALALQVVDALDLLEEALAAATELSDEVEEALDLRKVLGLDPPKLILPN